MIGNKYNLQPRCEQELTGNETVGDQKMHAEIADLRRAIEDYQRREANFLILQETVLDLSNRRETQSVLRAIVRRARQFARSDFCYLSVRDELKEEFYALVNEGGVTPSFATVRMGRQQGILSKVIDTAAPFFTSNYHEDTRFAHHPSVDEAMLAEGIISVLGVPLLMGSTILGVFFVADRRSRVYQPGEIAMLSSLAAHAALALESARLLDEARAANAMLEAQRSEIAAAAAAHEQMTDLVAHGGSSEALAELLARLLQGQVTVLDPASRVVCEAAPEASALLTSPPPHQVVRGTLAEARSARRSITIADCPNYRIAPVLGGGELLGGLLLHRLEPTSPAAIRTLERAAIVMGIVLLSQERRSQRAHREANELVSALFADEIIGDDVEADAIERGLGKESAARLLILEGPNTRTSQGVEEVRSMLDGACMLVGSHKGRIAAFLPADRAEALAWGLIERLRSTGVSGTSMALSRPIARISGFRAAHRTCLQMMQLADKLGVRERVVTEDQFGLYAMLFDADAADQIQAFIQSTISPLLKRDRASSSDLAGTLLVYMDHGHSARSAAEALHIHTNTLRQRLDTVGCLMPGWDHPNRQFEVHAALRLHHLCRSLG